MVAPNYNAKKIHKNFMSMVVKLEPKEEYRLRKPSVSTYSGPSDVNWFETSTT